MRDRRLLSKNLENISKGSRLVWTCGPGGTVQGSTVIGLGVMLQPTHPEDAALEPEFPPFHH
ncbi:hypothetical protein GBAR_LOCUS2025, partial [Geodia barretti]